MLYLVRSYHFSAAHRLVNPGFNEEKNWAIYNKCTNPHGHGHNYELELIISGQPDPVTGMLVDLAQLDAAVNHHLIDEVDHKHLNHDVPFLEGVNPTAENLAVVFYNRLAPLIPAPAKLYGLRMIESRNNRVDYFPYTTHQLETPVASGFVSR